MHSNHGHLFTQTSHYLAIPLSLLKGWQSCIFVPCTQERVKCPMSTSLCFCLEWSKHAIQQDCSGSGEHGGSTNCLLVQEKRYPCRLWNFLMLDYASHVAQLARHFVLALAGDSEMRCTSVTLVKATAGSHSPHCFPNPDHFTSARGPSKSSVLSACCECLMDCQNLLHLWLC